MFSRHCCWEGTFPSRGSLSVSSPVLINYCPLWGNHRDLTPLSCPALVGTWEHKRHWREFYVAPRAPGQHQRFLIYIKQLQAWLIPALSLWWGSWWRGDTPCPPSPRCPQRPGSCRAWEWGNSKMQNVPRKFPCSVGKLSFSCFISYISSARLCWCPPSVHQTSVLLGKGLVWINIMISIISQGQRSPCSGLLKKLEEGWGMLSCPINHWEHPSPCQQQFYNTGIGYLSAVTPLNKSGFQSL